MKCPVCAVPLIVVERHGIELDCCIACKGFWFDVGELELLPQALEVNFVVPDIGALPIARSAEKVRRCPRCNRHMEKVSFDGPLSTVVDRCPGGEGLWFDRGELPRALGTCPPASVDNGTRKMISFLGETFAVAVPDCPPETVPE